jgi:hypothetical protein
LKFLNRDASSATPNAIAPRFQSLSREPAVRQSFFGLRLFRVAVAVRGSSGQWCLG